jgi:hypothetical protein
MSSLDIDETDDLALLRCHLLSGPIRGLDPLLPGGVCSGVAVLAFHTPSIAGSSSSALMPNGISSLRPTDCSSSPLSAFSSKLFSTRLSLIQFLNFITEANARTRTYLNVRLGDRKSEGRTRRPPSTCKHVNFLW